MLRRHTDPEDQGPHWLRRIVLGAGLSISLVVAYAFLYQWVMVRFEGETVPYIQALQVVVEALTTAGFGGHSPWESSPGNAIIILMNLSGVLLVFMAIPVFLAPLFRELFESTPPRSSELTDHVIVCGYAEKDEILRDELQHLAEGRRAEIPFLYVEPEEELVETLRRRGVDAMVGDLERVETLRAANASEARALVADVDDETNPSVILAARVVDEELPVLSVVQNHQVAPHHAYAGATRVIEARESFARGLAIRVSSSYAQKFRNALGPGRDLAVTELAVEEGCPLIGRTLEEAELTDPEPGSPNVVAAWIGGKFLISPPSGTPIRQNSILVVAGRVGEIAATGIHEIPSSTQTPSRVVVGGFGTVGRCVEGVLAEADIETTVIELQKSEERRGEDGRFEPGDRVPDIIGDITDVATLRKANISEADAAVLALHDDISTIYAALVINEIAPDVEVICRAADPDSVSTLYQAGADFVLSLANVTGEILVSEVLNILGERGGFLPASTEFELTRIEGGRFAGESLGDIDLRHRTECTVVAVERGDELLTHIRGEFVVADDDILVVAGSKQAVARMHETFLPDRST